MGKHLPTKKIAKKFAKKIAGKMAGAAIAGSIVMLAALGSNSARAYTETPAAPSQPPVAGQDASNLIDPKIAGSGGLSFTDPNTATPGKEGTELKIPGLGSLGVLPKLDFGLELLYGPSSDNPGDRPPESGDVGIKGTIKHRF